MKDGKLSNDHPISWHIVRFPSLYQVNFMFLLSLSFGGSMKDSCASVISVMVEHLMNTPNSKKFFDTCASIEEAMVDDTCQSKLANTSNGLLKTHIYLRT